MTSSSRSRRRPREFSYAEVDEDQERHGAHRSEVVLARAAVEAERLGRKREHMRLLLRD